MAAGAAMAVVGWWSGYKLGGVLSLFSAEFLEKAGFQNYWQLTFLILGILIILMNIGLMFINETNNLDRQKRQKENDKLISRKFKSYNIFTQIVTWISGTVGGPIISFLKKWFSNCYWNIRFCIFIQSWRSFSWSYVDYFLQRNRF